MNSTADASPAVKAIGKTRFGRVDIEFIPFINRKCFILFPFYPAGHVNDVSKYSKMFLQRSSPLFIEEFCENDNMREFIQISDVVEIAPR